MPSRGTVRPIGWSVTDLPYVRWMTNPFRCFNSSPEVIRLVVRMYVKYPLSLRNVEDLLTAQFTTTSTGSATSSAGKSIRRDARPPWPSGALLWNRTSSGLGVLRQPETSCH
jgi:hypothetical protein